MGKFSPKPPPAPPPPPPPPPDPPVKPTAVKETEPTETKLKKRRGQASTNVTGGMGLSAPAETTKKTLLGS